MERTRLRTLPTFHPAPPKTNERILIFFSLVDSLCNPLKALEVSLKNIKNYRLEKILQTPKIGKWGK